MVPPNSNAIILFDGVCNLCNGFVQFVIRHDKKEYFRFAALQSEQGRNLLQQVQFKEGNALSTVVLIENGKFYVQSTAALKVARRLSGLWPLTYAAIILPAFLRDLIYKLIAANRYRWFGKQESCMLPTPALKTRFL